MADNNASLHIDIRATDNVTKAVKSAQSSLIRFVGAISAAVASINAVSFPITSAADFERALADVAKTTNFTEQELNSLSGALVEMSRNMSNSALELANIAATAGQLGLGSQGVEAIEQFTESVARATTTFGIGEGVVAQYAAQILQVFNVPTGQVENLFSEINELSNNSVASAKNLLDVMRRVGNIAGLTAQDVGALAATTADFGVTSEVAGTTLVKFFSNMEISVNKFAKVMNVSTGEWVSAVETDALGAFKALTTELANLDSASQSVALKDLFGSGRIFSLAKKFVNDASNGFEILNKNIENSNDGFDSGTSSIEEYEKVMDTLNEQLKVLKNSFYALAIESGQRLIPQLKAVVEQMQTFLESSDAQDVFDSLVASIGELVIGFQTLIESAAGFTDVWANLLPVIKIFIGFQLGKLFLGLASSLAVSAVNLSKMGASWGVATAAVKNYIAQSELAAAINARGAAGAVGGAVVAGTASSASSGLAAKIALQKESILLAKANTAILTKNLAVEKNLLHTLELKLARQRAVGPLTAEATAAALAERAAREANIVSIEREIVLKDAAIKTSAAEIASIEATNAALIQQSAVRRTATVGFLASLTGAVGRLTAIARAATTAAGAFGLLKTALSFLGRIALGPIGLIVFTLAIFTDEILNFFGFVTDAAEKANDAAVARAEKKMKDHADKLVAIYKEQVKKQLTGTDKERADAQFFTEGLLGADVVFDEEGPEAYAAVLDKASKSLETAIKAAQGADVTIDRLSDTFHDSGIALETMKAETTAAIKEIENLEIQIDTLNALIAEDGLQKGQQEERLAAAEAAYERRKKLIDKNYELMGGLIEGSGAAKEASAAAAADNAHFVAQIEASSEALANALSANSKVYLDATYELKSAQAAYDEVQSNLVVKQDALEKITGVFSGGRKDAAKEEIEDLNTVLLVLLGDLEKHKTIVKELDEQQGLSAQSAAANAATAQRSADALLAIKLADNGERKKSEEEIKKATALRILEDETLLRVNQELKKSFDDISAGLRNSIQTAKSVFNNMAASMNAARKSNKLFFEELAATRKSQVVDREVAKVLEEENRVRQQALDLQTQYYERLAREREARGDTSGAKRAREDLAALQDTFNKETERNAVVAEYTALVEKNNSLLEESKKLQDNIAQAEAFDPEKFKENLRLTEALTEEQITQRTIDKERALLQEVIWNTDRLKKFEETGKQTLSRIAELGGKVDPVDPFGGLILDKAKVDKVVAETESTVNTIRDIIEQGITQANEFAITAEAGLVASTQELTSEIQVLSERLVQLKGLMPEYAGVWVQLADSVGRGVGALTGSVTDLSEKMAGLKSLGEYYPTEGFEETAAVLDLLSDKIDEARTDAEKGITTTVVAEAVPISKEEKDKLTGPTPIEAPVKLVPDEGTVGDIEKLDVGNIVELKAPVKPIDDGTQDALDDVAKQNEYELQVKIAPYLDEEGRVAYGPQGRAGGGYIRGAGTTTSDSILARLSDKEYVIKAAAVQHYGVSRFNELNAMRLPKFAQGGQVNGESASTSTVMTARDIVNLNLSLGGSSFPLAGDRDVVRRLTSALGTLNRGTR